MYRFDFNQTVQPLIQNSPKLYCTRLIFDPARLLQLGLAGWIGTKNDVDIKFGSLVSCWLASPSMRVVRIAFFILYMHTGGSRRRPGPTVPNLSSWRGGGRPPLRKFMNHDMKLKHQGMKETTKIVWNKWPELKYLVQGF